MKGKTWKTKSGKILRKKAPKFYHITESGKRVKGKAVWSKKRKKWGI